MVSDSDNAAVRGRAAPDCEHVLPAAADEADAATEAGGLTQERPLDEPLGLASGTVRVVPYDRRWPALYAREARRLLGILEARGLSALIEHTGSTAVPGLAAKPIIDILVGRHPETPRPALISAVESAGYVFRGEQGIPQRDFFRRGTPRSYHVHVTPAGSDFWRDHRAFRDYLRAHGAAADDYARLKLALARQFAVDREAYIAGKTTFVERILALALA